MRPLAVSPNHTASRQALETTAHICVNAGDFVMALKENATQFPIPKKDKSLYTFADRLAEAFIVEKLKENCPMGKQVDGFICEEMAYDGKILPPNATRFFVIDPIDGSDVYISATPEELRNGDKTYSVNVGFVEDLVPTMGVIHLPETRITICAIDDQVFRYSHSRMQLQRLNPIHRLHTSLRIGVTEAERNDTRVSEVFSGSEQMTETDDSIGVVLKILAGELDACVRLGTTVPYREWDVCAVDAVLRAAGGDIIELETGKPLKYNQQGIGYQSPPMLLRSANLKQAMLQDRLRLR